MPGFKAIIWDCDGVLMDSPALGCLAAAQMLTEHGYPVDLQGYFKKFLGKGLSQVLKEVDAETGSTLEKTFPRDQLEERQKQLFNALLKPTSGVMDVLRAVTAPMAVASDSNAARLEHTLALTGLADFFKGHVYSAHTLQKPKPDPAIFLYAAEQLGIAPEDCLVIEDGDKGVRGAKAAGMTVCAYLGASHMTEEVKQKTLAENPDYAITDFRALLPLLAAKSGVGDKLSKKQNGPKL